MRPAFDQRPAIAENRRPETLLQTWGVCRRVPDRGELRIVEEIANVEQSGRSSALEGFPVVIRLPIQWGDLDAYAHVNNTVYLKWFEAARAVYASRVGVEVTPGKQGVGGVLAGVACKYLRQPDYPGDVLVGVRMTRLSLASATLQCRIVDAVTGVPVAEATCDVVFHDYAADRIVPVPETLRAAVETLEGKRFPL